MTPIENWLAEFATAVLFLIRLRRWRRTWLLGLAAGLVLLFVLYVHVAMWIGAALVCGIFATILGSSRRGSQESCLTSGQSAH